MEWMGQYLLRIVSAGLICAALGRMLPGKGAAAALGKMMTGLFLAFAVISPLSQVQLGNWQDWMEHIQGNAQSAVADGEEKSKEALRTGIKQRTEAYILDKAETLGCAPAVEVILNDDPIPLPVAVRLSGNISPYAKKQLQDLLASQLGIPKEAQQWT